MSRIGLFDRWRAPASDNQAEVRAGNGRLEYLLDRLVDAIEFGPIPAGQLSLSFQHEAAPITTGVKTRVPIAFDMRPLYFGCWIDQGGLTVQLNTLDSDVLDSDTAVATEVRLNRDEHFVEDLVINGGDPASPTGYIDLEVVSIDSGTPAALNAILICQNVAKIGGSDT